MRANFKHLAEQLSGAQARVEELETQLDAARAENGRLRELSNHPCGDPTCDCAEKSIYYPPREVANG